MRTLTAAYRAAAAVATIVAASCGGAAPTAPSSAAPLDRVALATGAYQFLISSTGPACEPPGSIGFSVLSNVTLSHTGTTWIARSTSAADGDMEFRFADTGEAASAVLRVSGTVVGTAISTTRLGVTTRATMTAVGGSPGSAAPVFASVLSETQSNGIVVLGGSSIPVIAATTSGAGAETCGLTITTWALVKPLV